MTKTKMTMTIRPAVLADTDADARDAGLNRSQYVERVLRDEHYRRLMERAGEPAPMSEQEEAALRELLAWQATLGGDGEGDPA